MRVSWSQSYNGANSVQHLYNIYKNLNHPCCDIETKSPILARFSLFDIYKCHINFLIIFHHLSHSRVPEAPVLIGSSHGARSLK